GPGRLITGGDGNVTLTGLNTYSGGTTLGNQTRVIVSSDANLGATAGQLAFDNGVLSVANGFSSARTISMISGAQVEVNAGTATLSGSIVSGNANNEGGLTKRGAGTLIYSGNATYGIDYSVLGGTLRVGSATAINPAGFLFVQNAGSVLDLNGYSVAVSTLGGTTGGLVTNSSNTAVTLTVRNDANANIPFAGNIQDGGGRIGLDIGGRSYILSGNNTYSGATNVSSAAGITVQSATALSANSAYTVDGFLNLRTFNGTIAGAITNPAGAVNVGGSVTGNGTVGNAGGATFAATGTGAYTASGLFSNAGLFTVAAGGQFAAQGGMTNAGTVTNAGTFIGNVTSNAGSLTNSASWTGNIVSSGTLVNAAGATWTGNVGTSGSFTNAGALTGDLAVTAGQTIN
ncbi:MAG: hypothetical protein Q7T55_09830, partial [Solirubrobacteraceae bacterium]|nr:hypothetical protein [Solirubrobacteraceae bacterium]